MRWIKPEDRIIVNIPDYEGAGIYVLRNLVNGKVYVGSATNIRRRILSHDSSFRNAVNVSVKLYEDVERGHKFSCEVVEKCDHMMFYELRDREKYYSDKFNSFKEGYNAAPVPTYDIDYYIRMKDKRMFEYLTREA